MTLLKYLSKFDRIAWYPSAGQDFVPTFALSSRSLFDYGFFLEDVPDCFLFTDFDPHCEGNHHSFFLDVAPESEVDIDRGCYKILFTNIRELQDLDIPPYTNLINVPIDEMYYGRVFVGDIFVEHESLGRTITKFAYVLVENTAFAFDFLLENKINVPYVIYKYYGLGFGGSESSGAYIFHILNDLNTVYFVYDGDNTVLDKPSDIADNYLSPTQSITIPVLHQITDFTLPYNWNDAKLYVIIDFQRTGPGFFGRPRFVIR